MSTILDVADAVVVNLNAGSFSQAFTAERTYQPVFDLPELAELKVTVVPRAVTITTASRQDSDFDCAVDVGVQKRIAEDNQPDELIDLVEQIADHLRHRRLDGLPAAAWRSIAYEPVLAAEHLDQQRVFTSVLTATYRVRR